MILLLLLWATDYSNSVKPLIQKNCTVCHRLGGAGPFSLLTYEDVRKHASQIARVTQSRYMPPWLPDNPPGTFLEERRLSPQDIQTISRWVGAGCLEGTSPGDTASTAEPPQAQEWQLGTPDLILHSEKSYRLPASGPDVFWNFVLQNPEKRLRYVRAVEIRPGEPRLVHHANLLIDRTGQVLQEKSLTAAGFEGMELNLQRNPLDPESHFLFWKPGSLPYSEPPGFSWALAPGNVIILNTHLQPSGKQEEVAPSVGIYFTDEPPREFPILVQLQNDRHLQIPAGVRDFVVEDRMTIPVNSRLLAIYPHAHYLGTLLVGTAILPDGTRRELVRIPHWDLAQQAVYRYRIPLELPKGTVVSMKFHYDNSRANVRNPFSPPRTIHAGNAATDEMGHLWLQLLPEGKGDHRRPIQEAVIRHGMEREPQDPSNFVNLGALLLSKLDAQGAISALRAAIRLDARRPQAYDMLGAALQNTGQIQLAIEQYRAALAVDNQYMSAHYNLAVALLRTGQLSEALLHMKLVSAAFPDDKRLQNEYQMLRDRVKLLEPQPSR